MTTGYSGTPLRRKLGLEPPMDVLLIGAPAEYRSWLGDLPADVSLVQSTRKPVRAAHIFTTEKSVLARHLRALRDRLQPSGFVWVSWPKKASGVRTDITEDVIRELAFPLGLVDVKVCAVDETWSGLKLVIRRANRGP